MKSANAVVPKRNWKSLLNVGAITAAATAVATNAFAVETVADMVTAVDMAGVKTAVYALLLLFIGVGVLFKGRAVLQRLGVSI